MKSSTQSVTKFRWNTILWAITFITIVFCGVHIVHGISWLETIILWTISGAGAAIIIWFAFHQVEKLKYELQDQLSISQSHSQRQAALARLSAGFTTVLDEDGICREIAQRLNEVQGYEYVAVYLVDYNTDDRVLRASIGGLGMPDGHRIPPGIGLSEQPLLDGKLQYTPEVSGNQRYLPGLGHGSEVDIPIQFKGEKLGVIVVENHKTDAFGPEDFSMLSTAADQAAIAIQNNRLLALEIKRRREAEILHNAIMAVSSNLDLDQVLDRILIQLAEVVPYDSSSVFLWKGDFLHAQAAQGLICPDQVLGHLFPASNELFQLILERGHPVILEDIRNDPRFMGWGGTDEIRSWMGVPLVFNEEITGYLTLDNQQINAYHQADADLAQIFANQAAIALHNAQLYQSARGAAEKLMILHEVSQKITRASFDPERTYVAIHQAAEQLMPCEAFSITILDQDNDEIEAVYLVDRNGRTPSMRIPADEGLSGHIISSGEPILVHDFLDAEILNGIKVVHFGHPDHIRAFVAVPLRLGNKVVGMLSSQSYQPHKYSIEDQQMLEVLAAHAAIALDNAKLFTQVQRLAITDSLTNVYNRRYFFDIAQREFHRAVRYHHPLSVIMLDIDHYKIINDTYGHVVGDVALKVISKHFMENIRETDTLGRYGGDEFSILLPETDLEKNH